MSRRYESQVVRRILTVRRSTVPKTRRSLAASFLGHPITVSIVGAILTATVVPFVGSKITDHKALQDSRIKVAQEILSDSAAVDERLSSLQTMLENFYQDARSKKNGYVDAQNELRKEYDARYAIFDEHAWWWFQPLPL